MDKTIYTIGYSGFPINDFISILKLKKISLVVDVRSQPYSKYFPDYSKERIEKILKTNNIYYQNYAKEFGARQDNIEYYQNGYLDFEKYTQSDIFKAGFIKLEHMDEDYRIALMCAEKEPIKCHRGIMIARVFFNVGYNVNHLLPDNKEITQVDIENILLDKYFPNHNQINLFDNNEDIEKCNNITEAYRKCNAEIGFNKERE